MLDFVEAASRKRLSWLLRNLQPACRVDRFGVEASGCNRCRLRAVFSPMRQPQLRLQAARFAGGLLWLLAGQAWSAAWTLTNAQRDAVERGEIVLTDSRDPAADGRDAAMAQAAMRVAATPDRVFDVMIDCAAAATWVPFMVRCQVLETKSEGTEQLIAHRVDYGWYAPRVDYVFRARYLDRRQIRFENVSGDLEENDGVWNLELAADGTSTLLTYRVRLRPKFYLPQWLYRRGLRSEIPAMLEALRLRAEGPRE